MAIKAADVAKVALAAGKLVAGMTGHGAGWAHVDAAVSVGKAVKGLHGKKSPSRSPGQRLVDEVADAVTAAVNGSEWADLNPDQVDTVGRAVARALQDADVDDALVVAARDGADALLAQVSNLATTRSTRASLADPVTLEPLFDLMLRTVVHTVAPRVLSEPGFRRIWWLTCRPGWRTGTAPSCNWGHGRRPRSSAGSPSSTAPARRPRRGGK